MKQFDDLEEFLLNNQDQFTEEEPGFGHFNRFAYKLDELHKSDETKEGIKRNLFLENKKAMLIAASVALVALISVPLMNLSSNSFSQHQIDAVDEHLSTSIRESLNSPVLQANFESDEAFEATLNEITELEMAYVKLKHEYNSTNHCDNVLVSMRSNLEARLAILDCLNRQEEKVIDTSPFIHENYLLKHISDCYEAPVLESSTVQYSSLNY